MWSERQHRVPCPICHGRLQPPGWYTSNEDLASAYKRVTAVTGLVVQLEPDAVGTTFVHEGTTHTVLGWNRRSKRNQIMTVDIDGQRYGWSVVMFERLYREARA